MRDKIVLLRARNAIEKSNHVNLILDVDGVLTDGKFSYTSEGKQSKVFGSHDSDALRVVSSQAKISLVSADHRGFKISESRSRDMGIEIKLLDPKERLDFVLERKLTGFTIFVGDSFTDIPALKASDFSIAPANALAVVKKSVSLVLKNNGSDGAVYELCVKLFKKRFETYRD